MQLTSILLPILGLVSTLQANPIPPNEIDHTIVRRAAQGNFQVTGFRDSGSVKLGDPQGRGLIAFHVKDAATGIDTDCGFENQIGRPVIGLAPIFTPCDFTGISFAIQRSKKDYYLTIAHKYNKGTTVDSGTIWLGDVLSTTIKQGYESWSLQAPWTFEIPYKRVVKTTAV